MSEIDDFFGGGLPSAKFDVQGQIVGGRIVRVGAPVQQRDMDGTPKFWDAEKTEKMMQLPIDVQTDQRDPEIPGDQGVRTLYVKGDLKRAIGEAVRKAGVQGAPKVGGTLEVAWTGNEAAKKRGFNDKKLYTARYAAPAAGDGFFGDTAMRDTEQAKQVQAGPVDPFAGQPVGASAGNGTGPAQANPFADERPPF